MKRLPLVFALLIAACTGQPRSRSDSTAASIPGVRPDSAGWRFTYLPGPAIWLRYPTNRVLGVRDEWTPACDHPLPLFADIADTTVADRIIVRSVPAPFDSAVAMAGFTIEHSGPITGYLLENLHGAMGADWADTIATGTWRALSGIVEDLAMMDESDSVHVPPPPADNPDATMPPTRIYWARVAAVGPVVGRCHTMLAIETHSVVDSSRLPMTNAILRSILSAAHR